MKNISFLFGAGISAPVGLPMISELNDIMKDKFYLVYNGLELNYDLKLKNKYNGIELLNGEWLALLRKMYILIENELKICNSDTNINYEMILNFCTQLMNSDTLEVCRSRQHLSQKLNALSEYTNQDVSLKIILDIIVDSIKTNLVNELRRDVDVSYLNDLISFVAAPINNHKAICINTLNNDVIFEKALLQSDIDFSDGFRFVTDEDNIQNIADVTKRAMIYDRSIFELSNNLWFLKLHGSINWFSMIINGNVVQTVGYLKNLEFTNQLEMNKDVLNSNYDQITYKNEKIRIPIEPIIVAGTNIKIESYNYGLPLRYVHEFQKQLDKSNIMIVSGCSFGDRGINLRLINWLVEDSENVIIINSIEETLTEFICKLNRNMKRSFGERFKNQVKYIAGGIENLNEKTIEDSLFRKIY